MEWTCWCLKQSKHLVYIYNVEPGGRSALIMDDEDMEGDDDDDDDEDVDENDPQLLVRP